jgi:solute carrier family 35 protein E3
MLHASLAFVALTSVAASKTLVTKYLFEQISAPVAFSALSCVVTWLLLTPTVCCKRFQCLDARNVDGILVASVMIGLDLAFANVALDLLDVSVQQCIRATSPAFTMLAEVAWRRRRFPPAVVLAVFGICVGPVLMTTVPEHAPRPWGVVAMLVSVVAGAVKAVAAHDVIGAAKHSMGVLAFTWWIECVVGMLLFPWALWTGGAAKLGAAPAHVQLTAVWTAAYGGVRIVSQFCFLKYTSPTSLALSNVCVNVLTTLGGVVLFGDAHTSVAIAGMVLTLVMSAVYAILRSAG